MDEVAVTVTTVTCSAPPTSRQMAHSSVPGVSSMKQKTLQFALEWSSRTQEFQVGRQPIPSTGCCGNRESPVTSLPTRSWYDQVTSCMQLGLLDERNDDREGMRNIQQSSVVYVVLLSSEFKTARCAAENGTLHWSTFASSNSGCWRTPSAMVRAVLVARHPLSYMLDASFISHTWAETSAVRYLYSYGR